MTKNVQMVRMSTGLSVLYTGLQGQLTVDTGLWTVRVHDALTPGGHVMLVGSNNLNDVADKGVSLANLGGLAKVSNLADVADIPTARANLSVFSKAEIQNQIGTFAVATGTAQALAATFSPAITLSDGVRVNVRALLRNTAAAPAITVDANTAHPITKFGGAALIPGDIAGVNHDLILDYNLANTRFELLNPAGNSWPPGSLFGLTLSTAGASATFGIAAGSAIDSTNITNMTLAAALTKNTSAWAVGTGNGSLDTGAIANATWYHVWLIQRVDTGVVDVLISTSVTTPTMPANYTAKRLIGSMLTDGSAQWVKFSQLGDEFLWSTPIKDVDDLTAAVTTAITVGLSVPTGIQVNALSLIKASYIATNGQFYISSFDQTDIAASNNQYTGILTSGITYNNIPLNIRTNTLRQIRARFSATDMVFSIFTRGFIHPRGRLN